MTDPVNEGVAIVIGILMLVSVGLFCMEAWAPNSNVMRRVSPIASFISPITLQMKRVRVLFGLTYSSLSLIMYVAYYSDYRFSVIGRGLRAIWNWTTSIGGEPTFFPHSSLAYTILGLYVLRGLVRLFAGSRFQFLNARIAPVLAGLTTTIILCYTVSSLFSLRFFGNVILACAAVAIYVAIRSNFLPDFARIVWNGIRLLGIYLLEGLRPLLLRLVRGLWRLARLPLRIPRILSAAVARSTHAVELANAQRGTATAAATEALEEAEYQERNERKTSNTRDDWEHE